MLQNRFKFNLRFKTLGEVLSRLCALLLYAAGARLLGAEGFGLFSLALSYAMLSSVLIDSGTINIVTRNIARDRASAPALIGTVTTYKLAVAPVALLAVYVVVRFVDGSPQVLSLVRIAGVVAVAQALLEHLSSVLSGLERMDVEAWVKSASKVGSLALAVGFFYLDRSVGGFTFGMAVGLLLSLAAGLFWVHRKVAPFRLEIDRTLLKGLLRTGLPLFAAWIFITVYNNQDRYLLSILGFTPRDIGVYSASAKLVDALRPIPVLLMGAVFPILAEAALNNRPLFEKIGGTLVKYSVIALFPFGFGVTVFAAPIVNVIFGREFAITAEILQVGIWGFLFIFLNHIFLYLLVSADRQKKFLQGSILIMVVNAVACYVLYVNLGLTGGAWGLIIGEAAQLVFLMADYESGWARRNLRALFGMPALLATASLLLYGLARIWLPPMAAFPISLIGYGAMVWRASLVDIGLLRRFVV